MRDFDRNFAKKRCSEHFRKILLAIQRMICCTFRVKVSPFEQRNEFSYHLPNEEIDPNRPGILFVKEYEDNTENPGVNVEKTNEDPVNNENSLANAKIVFVSEKRKGLSRSAGTNSLPQK